MADVELTVDMETAQAMRNSQRLGDSIEKTGKKQAKLNKSFARMGKAAKFGGIALAAGVAAGAFAAKQAVGDYIDFANELGRTNTIAKLTGKDFADMRKEIEDTATATGIGAIEVTKSLEMINSGSIVGAKGFDTMRVAARGASAGFVEADEATTGLIAAMNNFDVTPLQAMDEMFWTKEKGIIQIDQYAAALAELGGTANLAGLTLHDVGSAMATLTKGGLAPEKAKTQFGAVLRSLTKKDFQEKIGGSAGIGTLDVNELGLLDTVKVFRELSETMSSVDFGALFPDDEAKKGMLGLLNAANGTVEELINMKQAVKGSLRTAELLAEGPAKELARNTEEMSRAFRSFGEAFTPEYMNMMSSFTKTMVDNKEGLIAFADMVAKLAGFAVSGIGEAAALTGTAGSITAGQVGDAALSNIGNPFGFLGDLATQGQFNKLLMEQANRERIRANVSSETAAGKQQKEMKKQTRALE